MSPEKGIKIGISTGCLMGRSPELALGTILQKKEIAETIIAANEIGLDGFELFHRRGLTFERFNFILKSLGKLEHKPKVLTVHAPPYYDRHSPNFTHVDSRFTSLLLAYMCGFFKHEPAPQLAKKLKAPLVVHAGIIKRLEEEGKTLKGKPWLVETEKPPIRPAEGILYHPDQVIELAQKHDLKLVFDTSRIGLAKLPLRETWELYIKDGAEQIGVIHLSGTGGKIVHKDFLDQHQLGEMREFFQQVHRDGWQGIIIIEHAPTVTPGRTYKNKKDQIKYTLGFLLANEIKPRRSYNLP